MTKPILTRAELKSWKDAYAKLTGKADNVVFNTIEQAVELLRLDCGCEVGFWGVIECDNCKRKQAFLARYDGKDGGK